MTEEEEGLPTAADVVEDKHKILSDIEGTTLEINTDLDFKQGDELVRRDDAEYYAGKQFVKGEKRERKRITQLIQDKIEDFEEHIEDQPDETMQNKQIAIVNELNKLLEQVQE